MSFDNELKFEEALIEELKAHGWKNGVLKNPTEKDLLKNWADILFKNNQQIDRLNNIPLTESEMQQIIEQITYLRTPLKLNGFINGQSVSIKRDNPKDKEHFGKEVSLKIYDRNEIAAGQSTYQIAEQPIFNSKSTVLNDRRGDLMLLINGMPVIHMELKKSDIPVKQAALQIEKYSHEGIFTGIYSLVQIFVAMTPEETIYFANPGTDGLFNEDFYFHWADFNNEPINDWRKITSSLLSIPMAHQLIGFYTVADDTDGILKVMRSYQYNAANIISDRVTKIDWSNPDTRGGYIWHTTGSGKTMTSFKSAQLIANSKDADKVVFLIDRIELGVQSLRDYKGFADNEKDIQDTEDTNELISKLKSNKQSDTLIVTSIQKMSRIKEENGLSRLDDIRAINKKRIVFIVDECHRSQFGDMHQTIKETFPKAVFFGFTGTPILDENKKKYSNTSDIFGNELHRYSIADGIRDKNVLEFDVNKITTFRDEDLKKAVALEKSKASDEIEAINDPQKSEIYNEFIHKEMAGYEDENNNYIKGIEDYIGMEQYNTNEHREIVVKDIIDNWTTLSWNSKFHSIFATSSIKEAIIYYRLFKKKKAPFKVTVLVDPNIDNKEGFDFKEDGLVEIYEDYKKNYGLEFSLSTANIFKKDIGLRLAHKKQYKNLKKNEQIDILIVVDQMLTGYDSKWINTLYLDKVLKYENIIQAFSRTNRLFGNEKPFGIIKYYRKPYTMKKNIEKAIKLYSGDKPYGIFVPKLEENVKKMNFIYEQIKALYKSEGIEHFNKIPDDKVSRKKFIQLFNDLNKYYDASRIQGFKISKIKNYEIEKKNEEVTKVAEEGEKYILDDFSSEMTEEDYNALQQRYIDIAKNGKSKIDPNTPYDIKGYLTTGDNIKINNDYMDSKFKKYIKALNQEYITEEELNKYLKELHISFSSLSQENQKFANLLIHDIQSGNIVLTDNKTFMDYITEYKTNIENDQIRKISNLFDLNEEKLRKIINSDVNEMNLNEFARFDDLIKTKNLDKFKKYYKEIYDKDLSTFEANIEFENLIREFILNGGFEI